MNLEKIVPDTSVLISAAITEQALKKYKPQEVIIHLAALSELEHQANQGRTIGFLGLEELKRLRAQADKGLFTLSYKGKKPTQAEIKYASLGEIDSIIRELSYEEDATLLTSDKIQYSVAQARGINALYLEPVEKPLTKLKFEHYFDETTMSVHLKENVQPFAKKGFPGNWSYVQLSEQLLEHDFVKDVSKEIIEEAKKRKIVKTIEAPRDLVLPDNVTQYAISHGDAQEIHDILLLTRPDYTLFDEMRNTKDFLLFADLRLAGIGLAGVIHATNPIDAIQRFVGRIELGVI